MGSVGFFLMLRRFRIVQLDLRRAVHAAWDNGTDGIEGAILIVSTMTFIAMAVALIGLRITLNS
jgi:hypothetical protein